MQTTLGAIVADSEESVALAIMWGGGVVLEPLWGREGVALDVSGLDDIRRACGREAAIGLSVVVERYLRFPDCAGRRLVSSS